MKPTIDYSTFDQIDLRIGRVVTAASPEWSNKLLEFKVDFGPEIGEKTILSGIKAWYDPATFVGKHYLFVVNLAERKMGEGVSQGMMVMSDEAEQPVPFAISEAVTPGSVVR